MIPALVPTILNQPQYLEIYHSCGPHNYFNRCFAGCQVGNNIVSYETYSSYIGPHFDVRQLDLTPVTWFKLASYQVPPQNSYIIPMVFDSVNNYLYLANDKIYKYLVTLDGNGNVTGISYVDSIAYMGFITIVGTNLLAFNGPVVDVIDLQTFTWSSSFGSAGTGDGQFHGSGGICSDGTDIYVLDFPTTSTARIQKFDLSYNFVSSVTFSWDVGSLQNVSLTYYNSNLYFMLNRVILCKYTTGLVYVSQTAQLFSNTVVAVALSNGNIAIWDQGVPGIKLHSSVDLSYISQIGASGDGSACLFWGANGYIDIGAPSVWEMGDGTTISRAAGNNQQLSWHGFNNYIYNSVGPHRVRIRVNPKFITRFQNWDYVYPSFKNLIRCTNLVSFTARDGVPFKILEIPNAMYIYAYYNTSPEGRLIEINRNATTVIFGADQRVCTPYIAGPLSDLPSTVVNATLSGTSVTAASIAAFTAISSMTLRSMNWWSTADVDLVLLSISDAIYLDPNHFTNAAPALNIGGSSNAAPSHLDGFIDPLISPGSGNSDDHYTWNAGAGKHQAIAGGSAMWVASHNASHPWTITFNGGLAEGKLLGNGDLAWNDSQHNGSTIYAQKFTAVAGTLADIHIKSLISTNIKVAIYADNAGEPGALLAYSNSAPVVAGWNTISLNAQVALVNGTSYWLAVNAQDGYAIPRLSGTGATERWVSNSYSNDFPNPMTGLAGETRTYAIAGFGLVS
jgi:hypothetical protein